MKKFLMWVGGIFIAFAVLVIAAIFVYGTFWGKPLDESSKKFVDESVVAVTSEWNSDELIGRASPELRDAITKDAASTSKLFPGFLLLEN